MNDKKPGLHFNLFIIGVFLSSWEGPGVEGQLPPGTCPDALKCLSRPQSSHGNTMKQFMDIFSLPEMTLLSCVNEHFLKNNIDYEPVHLYKDVKVGAGGGHDADLLPASQQQ